MKTILSSRKHHHLKRVSIFLIVIALAAGMVGCGCDGARYSLTMAVAPAGSGTATDLTNASPYAAGTVVSIKAEAAADYGFVSWTAPAGTFANPNAATTTFTMPAQAVTVTANFVPVYNLTMAVAPAGSGTATDLTNASPYAADSVVSIKAEAAAGYQLVSWTAPGGTFANPNAATTTFTMPAQAVTVTANFVFVTEPGPLDHFTCYEAYDVDEEPINEVVYLEDQFGAVQAVVEEAGAFCNPVEKYHDGVLTPISNPDHHLTLYMLIYEEEPQEWLVEVDNQFGIQQLTVYGPVALAVPTQKVEPGGHEPPVGLDHFLLYYVIEGPSVDVVVGLNDQFGDEPEVWIYEPVLFANPVRKTHEGAVTEIWNPEAHLVFYWTDSEYFETQVQVANQFGEQTLDVYGPGLLAVPSEKIEPTPLDHGMGYWAEDVEGLSIGEVVYLEDQFGAVEAMVEWAMGFGNPAEKWHDGVLTPISDPDHHLTLYTIDYEEEPQTWFVEVDNQFGTQQLTVYGPVALAVPTQKAGHEPPVGLDHFLLYEVIEGPYVDVVVGLKDQFCDEPEVWVYEPVIFANPVRKTHGDEVTEIMNPEEHGVIYWIEGGDFETEVQVVNQFGEQTLDVYGPSFLIVPSEKIEPTPLDHFMCYEAYDVDEEPINEVVYLEDQFGAVQAVVEVVEEAVLFCNPVEKWHDGVLTPISSPDHHLTAYSLDYEEEPQEWLVEVDNQFGTQQLTVSGPIGLGVPTQKEGHEPPVGLDHFLLYYVIEGPSVELVVSLNDQFGDEPEVWVYEPVLLANPVRKTHEGVITEICNPEAHLVFYEIEGAVFETQVQVDNQFGEQTLELYDPVLLAVPSEKTRFITEPALAVVAVLGDYDSQLTSLLLGNNIWAEERDWDVISDIGDYDVVVINEPDDPGETTFLDFLDAASDNGVGVVFTSSYYAGWPWGISLLEWYLGDPAGQSDDYYSGDVYYKVTQEHPIFDGWNVGDEITIITGGDWDHAWFWDYSGDTIAEVGSADLGIQGDAVAVGAYGGSTHVLLASLGPQYYTNVPHWTDDAKTIFINAVCFLAPI